MKIFSLFASIDIASYFQDYNRMSMQKVSFIQCIRQHKLDQSLSSQHGYSYIQMTSIGQGRYWIDSVMAAGSFGKVYADRQFAIKEIKLPSITLAKSRQSISALLANEIRILTQLNHPNIVKVYEVIEENNAVYIVMELCQADLRRYTDGGGCGQRKAVQIMKQVIRGYGELGRLGIVHRDLKPANILLGRGQAKLADFGMAKYVANESLLLRSHVGTPYYMAPQVLQRIEYSRKCDIWSLGVIFYELLFGQLPWQGRNESALLESIMSIPLAFPLHATTSIKEIISKMLAISENQRASLEQVEKLFELYQQGTMEKEEKSYHWTIVRKMLLLQVEHRSQLQYGKRYHDLSQECQRAVQKDVRSLVREEQGYLLQYLPLWRQK